MRYPPTATMMMPPGDECDGGGAGLHQACRHRGLPVSPRSGHRWWALLAAGGASRCLAGFRVLSRFVVGGLRVRIDLVGALELLVHLVAGGGRVGATYLRLVL